MNAQQRIAIKAVHEIVSDLSDHAGLENEWSSIDEDTQNEIQTAWIAIVQGALADYKAEIV